MKRRSSIVCILIIYIIFSLGCNNIQKHNQNAAKIQDCSLKNNIEYTINVVDLESKKPIKEAYISVLEVKKKFLITNASNVIFLPSINYEDPGRYHYGYSAITSAEGYLPRIDHSFESVSGVITIELKKVSKDISNEAYTEYFHGAAINETIETLSYYEKLPVMNNK